MSEKLLAQKAEPSKQLRTALRADREGPTDNEGRSQLDLLVRQVNARPASRTSWSKAVELELKRVRRVPPDGWWEAFERFVTLSGVQTGPLGPLLEQALTNGLVRAEERSSVHALLDLCGMPATATAIGRDIEFKEADFLRWLDLMIAKLPRAEDGQELVIEAAQRGQFSLDDFVRRLNEMRSIGGSQLGGWLRRFRETLKPEDATQFDTIADQAFGPPEAEHNRGNPLLMEAERIRSLGRQDVVAASRALELALKRLEKRDLSSNEASFVSLMQKTNSYNQLAQSEYVFIAAEKHKAVKEGLSAPKANVQTIKTNTQNLMDFLNHRFYEAAQKNFEFLQEYFSGKGKIAPRICIKGSFRHHSEDAVISIFRDHDAGYLSDVKIEGNTGFQRIRETGRYYLHNNLPVAAAHHEYVNPRLQVDRIYADIAANRLSVAEVARHWDSYWTGSGDDRSFYKSTLIVPMTLWDRGISDEFRDIVSIDNIDRAIFGFLCFDHKDIDYFDDQQDVNVGYIFANYLCNFVLVRLTYTDLSRTFKNVKKLFGAKGINLDLAERASWPRIKAEKLLAIERDVGGGDQRPKLIHTDDMLLKFARSKTSST